MKITFVRHVSTAMIHIIEFSLSTIIYILLTYKNFLRSIVYIQWNKNFLDYRLNHAS